MLEFIRGSRVLLRSTQVGRPVAERRLRVVDADVRRRCALPGVGHVGAVRRHGPAGGPAAGLLALFAPYPGFIIRSLFTVYPFIPLPYMKNRKI